MTRTSWISGTLEKRQRSPVRQAAAMSFRAEFLAPLTEIVPSRARPPVTRYRSCGISGGSYSQWNGFASAMCPISLPVPTRTLAMPALGDADPEEGRLERGPGSGEVGGLDEAGLDGLLGLAPGLLGLLEVDLGGHVRGLGHDDDPVRPYLEEPADDRERLLLPALPVAELAGPEGGQERRVVGQHAELALASGQDHRVDLVRVGEAFGRDDLQQHRHQTVTGPSSMRWPGRLRACRRGRRPAPAGCRPCPRGPP